MFKQIILNFIVKRIEEDYDPHSPNFKRSAFLFRRAQREKGILRSEYSTIESNYVRYSRSQRLVHIIKTFNSTLAMMKSFMLSKTISYPVLTEKLIHDTTVVDPNSRVVVRTGNCIGFVTLNVQFEPDSTRYQEVEVSCAMFDITRRVIPKPDFNNTPLLPLFQSGPLIADETIPTMYLARNTPFHYPFNGNIFEASAYKSISLACISLFPILDANGYEIDPVDATANQLIYIYNLSYIYQVIIVLYYELSFDQFCGLFYHLNKNIVPGIPLEFFHNMGEFKQTFVYLDDSILTRSYQWGQVPRSFFNGLTTVDIPNCLLSITDIYSYAFLILTRLRHTWSSGIVKYLSFSVCSAHITKDTCDVSTELAALQHTYVRSKSKSNYVDCIIICH